MRAATLIVAHPDRQKWLPARKSLSPDSFAGLGARLAHTLGEVAANSGAVWDRYPKEPCVTHV